MITFSARTDREDPRYLPPETCHLAVACRVLRGDGSAEDPVVHEVTVRNDGDTAWNGILRLDLSFEAESPRFFLPGFLYGTNRGDAPLQTSSKAPRLRKGEPDFPASSWWMTRSDRLSHPAAFAFTGDRITGLCASPYYLKKDGRVIPWTPGETGEWLQYAGFGCSLDEKRISYTLGYENAPWFFLDSHHYYPRAPLSGNCFSLEPGEEACFTVAEFSYPADRETGLNAAMRTVYGMYHEPPRRCQSPETAVRTIMEAVGSTAWLPENQAYAGFVFDKPDSKEVRLIPSISWTNGLAAAVPMLEAALRLGTRPVTRHFYFIGSGSPRILADYLTEAGEIAGAPELIQIGARPDDGVRYAWEMLDTEPLVRDIGPFVSGTFAEHLRETLTPG